MPTTTAEFQEIVLTPFRQIPVGAGLCRTCVKAPECTFPRDLRRPVRSCDEFEGMDAPRTERTAGTEAVSIFPSIGTPERGVRELKGLCVQCARRHTCAYPKLAGGVWHCDELA